IVDVYGNVSATAPETVTVGDSTITPPTGGTVTTNPGGTSELPGGSTVTTGDGPTITLPDGGTVDKDGNASGGENGKITIGDTTIAPPTGGTVTTDKDGKTELPGGSTITNGDTTVTIGGGTSGGSIDKDGNIKLPSGGDITVEDKSGNSSTITVPGTGGDVGVKDDGTVTVPGGSTVTPPGGGTITVPEGGGTVSGGGDIVTNITVATVSVAPTTASVEKGKTQQFTATVKGTNNPPQTVTWTLEGYIGTASSISASGLLTVGSGETAQTITVKATSTFDTTKNDTAAVTVTSTPITTYTITASASTGGSISPSGNVTAVRGENKTFTITASSGYSISSVTVDGANQGAISSYTFSNVQAPHTITAAFSKNSSGGDDGGSTGGGNTDNDDSTTVKPSEPTKDNPTPPTIGIVETPIKPDKNGNAKVEVSDSNIKDAINKAEAQAKKDGKTAGGISVTVNLTSKETVNSVSALLSADTLDRLIKAEVKNFTIQTNLATLRLDLEMLKALKTQAGNSAVEITVGKQDVSQLSKEAQAAIGGRPALSITATYQKDGKTQNITSLGKGRLSVSIPYTKAATEQSGGLYGIYVDGAGKVTYITGSSYDENSKTLLFGTNHLSIYGVGYRTAPQFTDIANHWAKADIEFVAGRGLLTGTAADKFSPDSSMTRGMFVTALGRLAEIDTSSYKTGQFTDVKADAYYAPYVNWAAKNNIVCGTTATTFAPNQPISRQEMAQMIANYAKAIGFNLPRTHQENIFADSAKIGEWAKVSVKEMQMAGIITGKNGNEFDPAGTATRAEVSAVLRRFVELALDSGTAQGWMQNDSGKWMYYKDGIKLTGKQTISGVSYDFNSNGETKTAPDWSFTTYTVVKGDSFWSIAWDHKVNMFTLASVNGKNIFSIIKAGDVLKIPQG
ncbi:MAG: S-layer homology domain-containing protein, partial [Oscillospiraceae bacterium]